MVMILDHIWCVSLAMSTLCVVDLERRGEDLQPLYIQDTYFSPILILTVLLDNIETGTILEVPTCPL